MTFAITAEVPPFIVDDSGTVCIRGTRIPIDTVIALHLQGETPERIVEQFDALKLGDVYATIAYYLQHRAEVDAYLRASQILGEQIRRQNEARFKTAEVHARLLSELERKKQQGE